ncbi:hypothetical protein COU20_01670 [Candidatus Kaiserbacteria bacterium CG10_big_fil_rev_8_21_14_0_10_59_10]|uniref:HYR domain-containing protein n=1 Tax=Candidatus Kaiserbacteria bacterium CG10_big_fil_rev_8_21_14_0_10_59_10 TaxID=1974612 RepID=A0A2H0U853_9BACT|nr:MAG: hypothetical protein COU20_01670 [Candidatus Kaiserbacteria bacterium CG10_big_fil_rev_8_21_14_0_10_59_10]
MKVKEPPSAPICTLSAHPTHVGNNGSSTLTWTTANATSVSLDHGIGSVALSGSHTVTNITSARTYTLTVHGPGGTVNCHTTITVAAAPPACTLAAQPASLPPGGSSTLTWSSSNAISAFLSGVGQVGLHGSRNVQPHTATTYVLTVYDSHGRSAQCQATVHTQFVPPHVTLTQIPYTGIDGGMGGAAYTLTLTSILAASLYLLLHFARSYGMSIAELPRVIYASSSAFARLRRKSGGVVHAANTKQTCAPPQGITDRLVFVRSESGAAPRIILERG